MAEKEKIRLPSITLKWSEWTPWSDILIGSRAAGGIYIPNKVSGVYEAKHKRTEKRLTIGKAANLRQRIRQGLVKGTSPHSEGKKIRKSISENKEDVSTIVVRWALTDRPAAVEEELHKRHIARFGHLPKYVDHT